MELREDFELPGSLFVELDSLENGFSEILLEVYRHGDRYVLLERAPTTGNRLLRFSSKDGGWSTLPSLGSLVALSGKCRPALSCLE